MRTKPSREKLQGEKLEENRHRVPKIFDPKISTSPPAIYQSAWREIKLRGPFPDVEFNKKFRHRHLRDGELNADVVDGIRGGEGEGAFKSPVTSREDIAQREKSATLLHVSPHSRFCNLECIEARAFFASRGARFPPSPLLRLVVDLTNNPLPVAQRINKKKGYKNTKTRVSFDGSRFATKAAKERGGPRRPSACYTIV